eukprot:TRINITY_DN6035_c0_g1_i2.p1 TRINITY_DN6035_c0_g1~~TRINITY_DN6035_c0_g1_i2.p1  ORF type:complete len:103 (+),score=4.84 TRINITY_DN6035_c0_g1_i2:1-309(+)
METKEYEAIHNAAFEGDITTLTSLLANGVDAMVRAGDGTIALHHACIQGHTNCVGLLLLQTNVDVNTADKEGSTPLHNACFNNHWECVDLLLQHGANVNIPP